MFLTTDNKMLWRRMVWGTLVTFLLILIGVFGLDVWIYSHAISVSDWNLWHVLGRIFDAKVWLFVVVGILAVYGVKRFVKTIQLIQDKRIRFNLVGVFKETWLKTKTSHAFLIFSSIFCASILVWVLKVLIARLRPVFVMSGQIPDFNRFAWAWHSMPSGHTAVTFAGLVMIGMLAPRYKPLTWTMAIIVGVSRICIGAHWFSDVIFGAFVGMLVADIVKWVLMKK